MHTVRGLRSGGICALVLGLIVPIALLLGSPPASASTTQLTWSPPAVIDPGPPKAVSCVSASFCVAVDASGYALTYNGTSWSAPASIDAGKVLVSVSCPTTTFCAAVDANGDALTYNGTSWSLPALIDPGRFLSSVSCASATFCAVVDDVGNVVTYNGTSWLAAVAFDAGNRLASVSCASASFCAAVDYAGRAFTYNGTSWSAPAPIDAGRALVSVSCPSATFCAALDGSSGADLAFTYNGTSWSAPVSLPAGQMKSVACASATFCAAVQSNGSGGSGGALTYNGTSWSAFNPITTGLNSVSCPSATSCTAVGGGPGGAGDVVTYNGASWSTPALIEGGFLESVSCPNATSCMAVDEMGRALRYNGSSWSAAVAIDAGSFLVLRSVSCPSPSFCAAVDDAGGALTYNGTTWSARTSINPGSFLNSVSCASATFCVDVDGSGRAVIYNGTTWSAPASIDASSPFVYLHVSCPSATFCAAVDGSGNALTYNGTSWTAPAAIDAGHGLNTVSCASATFCTAVDNTSGALTFNGTSWSAAVSIDVNNVLSVSCPSATFCAAVDQVGNALTYDGTSWSPPAPIAAGNSLNSVSCPSSAFCAAVGGDSALVGTSPQSAPVFTAAAPPTAATVGTAYGPYTFLTSGNPAPAFALAGGALPSGLGLSSTGVLSGSPTASGSFTFTVRATNGVSPDAVSSSITITVNPAVNPVSAPVNVTATATGSGGATVTWGVPATGVAPPSYTVTPSAGSGAAPVTVSSTTRTASFTGLTGSAITFAVQAGTGAVGTSNAVDATASTPVRDLVSDRQYVLTSSNGVTWVDLDTTNLAATYTPPTSGQLLLDANIDLWTANAGVNQDVAVVVGGGAYGTGTVVGWKESGGFAGTFSPNAAAVNTAADVVGGTAYTVKLAWKANQPAPGKSIVAGAGPIGGFSPTRLKATFAPAANPIDQTRRTDQFLLTGSNGMSWQPMNTTTAGAAVAPVTRTFTAAGDGTAAITGNTDLWTWNAQYNQDIALIVSGGAYGAGQLVAWKESGGSAGTFSPNAALVEARVAVLNGVTYTVQLAWKANKPMPAGVRISAAAGAAGNYSPTTITVAQQPTPTVASRATALQYRLDGSNGATWRDLDTPAHNQVPFSVTYVAPSDGYVHLVGNADLWTYAAGYNQDIAIAVTPPAADPGTAPGGIVAWKESGGFAGTFSPNAAAVEASYPVKGGLSYMFRLVWKMNKPASAAVSISAGAGSPGGFSPTRLDLGFHPK